ncbi:MAG: methylated-DNA--[protein]-cysteine S-methyltransferase [Pseudomonadota bacterium]|nr:methylated-DNA--[protein]-cysteine S-methyltransferase [Pseudomonadota bacterium]
MNDDPLAEEVARQLNAYFTGRVFSFDLPLAPPHSEIKAGISQCIIDIPFGEMQTYGELAKELGSASQAVGQACGLNPFPIIDPCHRVVAAGGRLGGFSGGNGVPTKRKLLNHEAVYAS